MDQAETQQTDKPKRPPTAVRRAKVAQSIGVEQFIYSVPQAQVVLAMGNTTFWNHVRNGRIKLIKQGRRDYVTREECQRFVRSLKGAE